MCHADPVSGSSGARARAHASEILHANMVARTSTMRFPSLVPIEPLPITAHARVRERRSERSQP